MNTKNPLAISDDDFLKLSADDFENESIEEEESTEEEELEEEDSEESTETEEQEESSKEESEEEESDDESEEREEEEETTEDEEETEVVEQKSSTKTNKSEKSKESDKETESTESIDYKAAYEKLTAPFKANGKELKVENIEEAITLMQKGANYNAKMVAIKPHLKMLRMLENHNLLDETKLAHLIDLSKHDKNAITKLLSDAKINPLDIDVEDAGNYVEGNYSVTDNEMRFNEVTAEIKGTPSYSRTVKIVTTEFDPKSKQMLSENPDALLVINTHVESGVYDVVKTELDRRRMLGKIASNLSELEAYDLVGTELHNSGALAKYYPQEAGKQQKAKESGNKPPIKKESTQNSLKDRKKAVAPVKGATKKATTDSDLNPLAMSDEEFLKQFG
jgi:hypothetical protein